MSKNKVTFADIAEYTGFSKTTVSRYFNNPDSLTAENQKKIAAALKALDYKENKLAKVLANGKTEMIGVIIPDLYFHYFAEMLNQIISTYENYGYKFIIFAGHNNKETEYKYINELLAYNIEGLIVMSHTIPSKELAELNIPLVTIEREDKYVSSVNSDNYMGGIQATNLLIKSGCDIVIHINDNVLPNVPAYGRIKGFHDCCKANDIPNQLILTEFSTDFQHNHDTIFRIFTEIEEKYPEGKIGIFMSNDTHACTLLNIIVRKYGCLPERYKLVGFDNSPISKEAIIPISTVGQQIELIAATAMDILSEQINQRKKTMQEPEKTPVHKIITPVLIRRETSI